MSINIPGILYVAQILLAELVFVYPADKRRLFPLRLLVPVLAILVVVGVSGGTEALDENILTQLVLFLSFFLLSVAVMALAFRLKFPALLSCCVAGYAVQHIAYHCAGLLANLGVLAHAGSAALPRRYVLELIVFPVVYLICYLSLGRYSEKNQCYRKPNMQFNFLSFIIIVICIGLTRVARYFGGDGTITVSLYAITCCLLALYVQFVLYRMVDLKQENTTIGLLWQEASKQYALSKKTIDTINIKHHDLKHRLRDMRLPQEEVRSIEEAVQVYQSQVKTGSEALDVLLTENSLHCVEEGITLTFMGNGADFSFMDLMDIYSLFGNAVENAVEAVRKLSDPEKKIIDIVSERKGNMISVNVSNYFTGQLVLEDGLPVTTKTEEEGFHGFGMKSMKLIAEKYGGEICVSVEGDLYNLSVYLLAR